MGVTRISRAHIFLIWQPPFIYGRYVADDYFHPNADGHDLMSDLLRLMILRRIIAVLQQPRREPISPKFAARDFVEERSRRQPVSADNGAAWPITGRPPAHVDLPRRDCESRGCNLTRRVAAILDRGHVDNHSDVGAVSAVLAWEPSARGAGRRDRAEIDVVAGAGEKGAEIRVHSLTEITPRLRRDLAEVFGVVSAQADLRASSSPKRTRRASTVSGAGACPTATTRRELSPSAYHARWLHLMHDFNW